MIYGIASITNPIKSLQRTFEFLTTCQEGSHEVKACRFCDSAWQFKSFTVIELRRSLLVDFQEASAIICWDDALTASNFYPSGSFSIDSPCPVYFGRYQEGGEDCLLFHSEKGMLETATGRCGCLFDDQMRIWMLEPEYGAFFSIGTEALKTWRLDGSQEKS